MTVYQVRIKSSEGRVLCGFERFLIEKYDFYDNRRFLRDWDGHSMTLAIEGHVAHEVIELASELQRKTFGMQVIEGIIFEPVPDNESIINNRRWGRTIRTGGLTVNVTNDRR